MRRVALAAILALVTAGCASKENSTPRRAKAAQPTLPQIHEGFTLLPCPRKNPARSTLGIEGCAEHKILRTDRRIIGNERAIFSLLHGDGRAAFAKAERSWLAYRSSYCSARASSYKGGSIAPVVFATCQVAVNRGHLKALSAFRLELQNR